MYFIDDSMTGKRRRRVKEMRSDSRVEAVEAVEAPEFEGQSRTGVTEDAFRS